MFTIRQLFLSSYVQVVLPLGQILISMHYTLNEKIKHLEAENFELRKTVSKDTGNQKQIINLQEELINSICGKLKTEFNNNFQLIRNKIDNLDSKINKLSKDKVEEKHTLSVEKTQTQIRNNKNATTSKQINTGTPKRLNTELPKQLHSTKQPSIIKEIMSEQHKALEDKQLSIMNEVINLGVNEGVNKLEKTTTQSQNNENNNWQLVQRKKGSYKRNIGQSEDKENNFRGIRPKVWMYIYKVVQETTEEDIKNFLQRKTGDTNENFIVKDLKEPGKFKSYMVAADLKYKDDFYKTSFWPMGVNYRRFDFNRHFEKYKTRNIISNENEERIESFLEVDN